MANEIEFNQNLWNATKRRSNYNELSSIMRMVHELSHSFEDGNDQHEAEELMKIWNKLYKIKKGQE